MYYLSGGDEGESRTRGVEDLSDLSFSRLRSPRRRSQEVPSSRRDPQEVGASSRVSPFSSRSRSSAIRTRLGSTSWKLAHGVGENGRFQVQRQDPNGNGRHRSLPLRDVPRGSEFRSGRSSLNLQLTSSPSFPFLSLPFPSFPPSFSTEVPSDSILLLVISPTKTTSLLPSLQPVHSFFLSSPSLPGSRLTRCLLFRRQPRPSLRRLRVAL